MNSHPGAFTLPCALTISFEFARFLDVKDKTFANAFFTCRVSTHPNYSTYEVIGVRKFKIEVQSVVRYRP